MLGALSQETQISTMSDITGGLPDSVLKLRKDSALIFPLAKELTPNQGLGHKWSPQAHVLKTWSPGNGGIGRW
jgi:hypothetical protein